MFSSNISFKVRLHPFISALIILYDDFNTSQILAAFIYSKNTHIYLLDQYYCTV